VITVKTDAAVFVKPSEYLSPTAHEISKTEAISI
jgi:hypothetical protein